MANDDLALEKALQMEYENYCAVLVKSVGRKLNILLVQCKPV
jgi:hypothetical protein